MEINELIKAKKKLEEDLVIAISERVELFTVETGFPISSMNVYFGDVSTCEHIMFKVIKLVTYLPIDGILGG